jgi:uncharacterized repeat protein (TIGR01451 family)
VAAQAGEPTTYTVKTHNNGPGTTLNPTVVLTFPPGATILMPPAGEGWTCTMTVASSYTCTRPSLVGGMDGPPIIAQIVTPMNNPNQPTPVVSATVGAPLLTDPNPGNNTVTVPAAGDGGVIKAGKSDLALTITKAPDPSTLGQETIYTLQLENLGPDNAQSPTMTFTIPPNSTVTYPAQGQGWTCVRNGDTFTCVRPEAAIGLAPPVYIKLITPLPADGSMNAGAVAGVVSAPLNLDPEPLNNSASQSAGNLPMTAADLKVTLTRSPDEPVPGGEATYTLQATNGGPGTVNDAVVTLQLPPGTVVLEPAAGEGWKCTQTENIVVCTRPQVPQGDAPPVTIKVRLPAEEDPINGGTGAAVATVKAANNTDPNNTDNVTRLDGLKYKLNGGGFGCTVAGLAQASGGASAAVVGLAVLLFASLRSRRRRVLA